MPWHDRYVTPVQQPSRRHHHVPQFYLSQWVDPSTKRLIRCERAPAGNLVEKSTVPRATGFEENLYAVPGAAWFESWSPDVIETDFMSPLDNAGAKALTCLLACEVGVVSVDADTRRAWARFLRSLMERHPAVIEERETLTLVHARQLVDEYRTRLGAVFDEVCRDGFDPEQEARNRVRTSMVQSIDDPTQLERLLKFEWRVFEPGATYITSDQPLLLNPGFAGHEPNDVYVMSIALSPRRLFVAYRRSWGIDPAMSGYLAFIASELHNMLVVDSQPRRLYSLGPIVDGNVARLRKMVDESFQRET